MNRIRLHMLWLLVFFTVGAAHAQLPDFTGLVSDASPSVVSVMATHTAEAQTRGMPNGREDAEMEELFRRFFDNNWIKTLFLKPQVNCLNTGPITTRGSYKNGATGEILKGSDLWSRRPRDE